MRSPMISPQQSLDYIESLPEKRKKASGKLIKLMSGFAEIIASASKKFELLVAKHSPGSPQSNDSEEMNDFEDINTTRSYEQLNSAIREMAFVFSDLANSIIEKSVAPIEANKDKLLVVSKSVSYDVGKLAKEVKESNSKALKAKLKYHKAKEELFELECEFEANFSSGIENALQMRILNKQSEFFESRDEYIKNLKVSRHVKIQNQKKVDSLMDSLQNAENDRIDSMRNGLIEFLTSQNFAWAKLKDSSFNKCEEVNKTFPSENGKSTIAQNFEKMRILGPTLDFEEWKRPSFIITDKNQPGPPKLLKKPLETQFDEQAYNSYFEKWSGWITKQFNNEHKGVAGEEDKEKEELISSLVDLRSRRAFGKALSTHRSSNGGHVQSTAALENIVDAMFICLDAVHLEGSQISDKIIRDVIPVREVMIVSQTIFFTPNESSVEKQYLASRIQNHQIWTTERIWDEIFSTEFETEKANKRAFDIQEWFADEEVEEIRNTNRNVVFGQLANIAHSMILFGNTVEKTAQFVHRISKIHHLPSDLRKQILSQIRGSPNK